MNSSVTYGTETTEQLRDEQNQIINELPTTPDGIRALIAEEINPILRRLNMEITGSIAQKRNRLLYAVGIVNEKKELRH